MKNVKMQMWRKKFIGAENKSQENDDESVFLLCFTVKYY